MDAKICDWTSPRVLRNLDAVQLLHENMWTAGILIVKNSPRSRLDLNAWISTMSKPWNLFDLPFEIEGMKHRHDQSILSVLIAKNKISMFDLGSGFYSTGIEATTGNLNSENLSLKTIFCSSVQGTKYIIEEIEFLCLLFGCTSFHTIF
jgi:hypothetical protein